MERAIVFVGNTEWDPKATITGPDRKPLEILSIPITADTTDAEIDALIGEHERKFTAHKPYRISLREHHDDEDRPEDCLHTVIKEVR